MDLRLPIGIIFTLYGLILIGYGFFTKGGEMYSKSLGININIIWGIVLLVFGLVMYFFSRCGKNKKS